MQTTLYRQIFLIIFLLELLSLAGYFFDFLNSAFFIILSIIFLIIAIKSLPSALLIIFAELFIGSKGYLFYFDFDGILISIRLMLFLIIMSVWLYVIISKLIKKELNFKKILNDLSKNIVLKFLIALLLIIFLAIINALIRGNSFHNLFFDLNGWLFFALLFPLFTIELGDFKEKIIAVFLAATAWLSVKTLVLLYLFSHLGPMLSDIYRWVRISGVGEITMMPGNFYRIFIQSQIFVLAGIIIALVLILKNKSKQKSFFLHIYSILLIATTIIGMSRSNWLGLGLTLILFFITYTLFYLRPFKIYFNYLLRILGTVILSVLLIFFIVKIPWPSIGLDVNTMASLRDRTGNIESEAGAASRWALLPAMLTEIKTAPIFGKGFGTTVSYRSSDPRVLEANPDKLYTTYAFEWGWLDVWLKLGIFGLLAYAGIFAIMITQSLIDYFKEKKLEYLGIACLMVLLATVNFFSPYLNHPLGIGYLLLVVYIAQHTMHNA
jgi:hypothetical protein